MGSYLQVKVFSESTFPKHLLSPQTFCFASECFYVCAGKTNEMWNTTWHHLHVIVYAKGNQKFTKLCWITFLDTIVISNVYNILLTGLLLSLFFRFSFMCVHLGWRAWVLCSKLAYTSMTWACMTPAETWCWLAHSSRRSWRELSYRFTLLWSVTALSVRDHLACLSVSWTVILKPSI